MYEHLLPAHAAVLFAFLGQSKVSIHSGLQAVNSIEAAAAKATIATILVFMFR